MRSFDWPTVFDEVYPEPGASDEELDRFVRDIAQPLSRDEIQSLQEKHRAFTQKFLEFNSTPVDIKSFVANMGPLGDTLDVEKTKRELEELRQSALKYKNSKKPESWTMPERTLPRSYLDFLRWSNGGAFRCGARWFDPVFKTDQVRGTMLAYDLPEYMPQALAFAFDGAGTFYLLDMRQPPVGDEYPVLIVHASNLGFNSTTCRKIASSFIEACR
jgi:hypothetical protein